MDDKIQQLTRKKQILEKYKKGCMQQILLQTFRFKDDKGKAYPDWEEKTLKTICNVKGGKRIPKGLSLVSENNGFPYITVSDMENGSVSLKDIKYVPLEATEQIKNYKITTQDIYISVAGTLGLVGIIPAELENANLTENANKLTNIKCNQTYLLYYLKSDQVENLIKSVKTSNAQPKLAIYAINDFIINLPTLQEQQKIANFLSAIDNKINNTHTQLQQTQQYKKGLLQQMFI